jgi:hypothetical protein
MPFSSQKTPLIYQAPANRSFVALLWQSFSLQPHGSDSISPLLYHNWLSFVHQWDPCIGQYFTTSWNTWPAPLASRSRIAEARAPPTCYLAMPTRIGETAGHCDQRLVRSCCTTSCRSCGGRRCRRLLLQRPRLSTIQHLWQRLRFSISELFSNDLATLRRRPHKCTRTTPRASSGATPSSADGDSDEPSTLISASTLLMK